MSLWASRGLLVSEGYRFRQLMAPLENVAKRMHKQQLVGETVFLDLGLC